MLRNNNDNDRTNDDIFHGRINYRQTRSCGRDLTVVRADGRNAEYWERDFIRVESYTNAHIGTYVVVPLYCMSFLLFFIK